MGIGSSRQRQRQSQNVTYAPQQYPYGQYPPPPVYPQQQALPAAAGGVGTAPYFDSSSGTYPAQYVTNGQVFQASWRQPSGYGGGPYGVPGAQAPQPPVPFPPPPDPRGGMPAAPPQEFTQTATIRNCVNLKKETLKLVPLPDNPDKLQIQFSFDASTSCRVSTFVMATEDPARFKLKTRAQAPGPPLFYERGLAQRFPKPGDAAAVAAHVVDLAATPEGALGGVSGGDTYPLVIRLEALSEEGVRAGRSLADLAPGAEQKSWVQSQTTYAAVAKNEEGEYECRVLEQKIWVKGVSYKLQEIYGMDHSGSKGGASAAADDEERLCVICLSNDRDTTVLPCRHMCMCKDCAQELSKQTSKCPICRNQVDSLLHIKVQRRSRRSGAAPTPAAGAGGGGS